LPLRAVRFWPIGPLANEMNKPIIIDLFEQGSQEWLDARVGCVTMSNAGLLLVGGKGITRKNYIIDVASEMISGIPSKQISTFDIDRGNALEPMAREAYELLTGTKVRQIGIGYLDEMKRIAASPDGLTDIGGIEIKCPQPKAHLRTILAKESPKEYQAQMQGCMWVFGVDRWDFVSFCPQFKPMPICIISVNRDEEMIKLIEKLTKSMTMNRRFSNE